MVTNDNEWEEGFEKNCMDMEELQKVGAKAGVVEITRSKERC